MATEVEKKETETKEPEKKARLMDVAEYKMLIYVIPVGLVLLVIALLLGK
jgi:hypothetical protein